jgi:hypothetical protein
MEYKILVKDKDGTYLGEFENFRDLSFGKKLNEYGECTFSVPVKDPKINSLIALRKYEVEIYQCEEFTEQTKIWAGEQASRVATITENGDDWVDITCYSYLEMLNHRFTVAEKIYAIEDYMDSGDIAWDLINTTQSETNGDLGITEGDIEPTIVREIYYYNQNIMNALMDLANMTYGFDFDINDDKEFNVWATKGVDRSEDVQLILGKNVDSCTIVEDFTNPCNRSLILGTDYSSNDLLRIETDNEASQGSILLRESIENNSDVTDTESLNYLGGALLRKYKQPILSISVSLIKNSGIKISDFSVGDTVRAIIKKGIYNFNLQMRVHEWNFKLNEDKTEDLSLTLSIL